MSRSRRNAGRLAGRVRDVPVTAAPSASPSLATPSIVIDRNASAIRRRCSRGHGVGTDRFGGAVRVALPSHVGASVMTT
ncbi:hypothetical protein [Natrinema gari]|uniref:Uncharacterized protein n=1 Tax=Natrinema gari JCM 14663 TaxID=1230459 RepID=L9Z0Y3_9EURY|nr:hypothetical protein [Natrinema gari]ELY78843.1 hypothetical protein C486_12740 [Natrinema gari JCM 14663]